MRILGDLVFAGLGQVKALRVENLATDPSSPSSGQVWYNTTDGVYRGYDGTTIISFATGGNATQILNELNQVETSAGLNTDGTLTAPTGTSYLGAISTLKGGLVALDTQVKTNSDAITTLQTRATTDEGLITGLQTEVDAIETGVGLNPDGTWTAPSSNYIASATDIKTALTDLDTQIKANTDAIPTKVSKSGDSMTGSLVMGSGTHVTLPDAPSADTDATNKGYVDARLAGLKWKDSARVIANSPITLSGTQTIDGISVLADERVVVAGQATASANGIYVVKSGAWVRATDFDATTPINEITAAAVWVESGSAWGNTGWVVNSPVSVLDTDAINFVQFNGASGITAGIGLTKSGNTLHVQLGAGIAELPTDEVGLDLFASSGLFLTEDGSAVSSNTGAQLAVFIDGTTLSRSTTGLKVANAGITEVELNASVAGAGLTGGSGSVLAVGAGTGITVNANDVALDLTYADGRYINVTGDTMTGDLILNADPTNVLGAVTKQYADAIETRLVNSFYVYNGSSAAATHVVTHNIGSQYCNVTIVDSADKVIIPDSITFDSASQLTVVFASSITCKVIVAGLKQA